MPPPIPAEQGGATGRNSPSQWCLGRMHPSRPPIEKDWVHHRTAADSSYLHRSQSRPRLTELELGSGPGFLAAHLLEAVAELSLVPLDCSTVMHELARERLRRYADRVVYVERDFRQPGWQHGLGAFDAIVTNQSVHELRHKRHAAPLHAAARTLLRHGGPYLVSDHRCSPGFGDPRLYMTETEHRDALLTAGFTEATLLTTAGTLVLYRARSGDDVDARGG